LGLKRAGLDVMVYERHPEVMTTGVGLTLWPNGVRVIHALGLADEFARISGPIRTLATLSSEGETLFVDDLRPMVERFGAPMAGAHRLELNRMLARALGDEHLRPGHRLVSFEQADGGVSCRFEGGAEVTGEVLVGADGVHSQVRRGLFGEARLVNTGEVRWRGIFRLDDVGAAPDALVHVLGDHGHFGWLPIGGGRAYWYSTGERMTEWPEFERYFSSWSRSPVPAVMRATPNDTIIRNELEDPGEMLPAWGSGRVTLLGDAAHPMLPGLAQGACQALQDAESLARHLGEARDRETGLRGYECERVPKGNRVVELSRQAFEAARIVGPGPQTERKAAISLVDKYEDEIERE
jgi:2-polyprenyl-6-methoxyphenol hydroxylase-like FAD-dependent oxidoreductase